jgi:hypothetical protein
MGVVWWAVAATLGSVAVALLMFLGVLQARVWRSERQEYLPQPDLSPAQVLWANEKRLSEDPEATLIIPFGDPDYIRAVDWPALRAQGKPWPFRTGAAPATPPSPDNPGHAAF